MAHQVKYGDQKQQYNEKDIINIIQIRVNIIRRRIQILDNLIRMKDEKSTKTKKKINKMN